MARRVKKTETPEVAATETPKAVLSIDEQIAAAREALKELRAVKRATKGPRWSCKVDGSMVMGVGAFDGCITNATLELTMKFADYCAEKDWAVPTTDEIVQAGMGRIAALNTAKDKKAEQARQLRLALDTNAAIE